MRDTNTGHKLPTRAEGAGNRKRRRRGRAALWAALPILVIGGVAAVALSQSALTVKHELEEARTLVPQLRNAIENDDLAAADDVVSKLQVHTAAARQASSEPLWTVAGTLPWIGANFRATTEVAISADDMATLGAKPLAEVFRAFDWRSLTSGDVSANLAALESAVPKIRAAAYAVDSSTTRLESIDSSALLPSLATPLSDVLEQLRSVSASLSAAADTSEIVAKMMGGEDPHSYLLMIQNNAESRASGGIPGALAVVHVNSGKLTLGAQASAGDIGVISPELPLDQEQSQIYSVRLGKFLQDVNLTPDFPTAASNALAMWEKKFNQKLEGVISIDPVALGYVLDATGPVEVSSPELSGSMGALPTVLNGQNVVKTLLSDVYSEISQPQLQDAYFAGLAQQIFAALSSPTTDAKGLLSGISRATDERRLLLWSGVASEQELISKYPLSGSVTGPSVLPAQFGVYFNDGTGAKMDYYVKRTVQLIKECAKDGFEQTTVRITSTNTVSSDAAATLPAYVTGNGNFGIPPGSVQTNIVAYGPVQANVETAKVDGQRTDFAPHFHSNRPVGMLALRLAPGESRTVEFSFGKIVQHTEPNVIVTPTVQDVSSVILPTQAGGCDQ